MITNKPFEVKFWSDKERTALDEYFSPKIEIETVSVRINRYT